MIFHHQHVAEERADFCRKPLFSWSDLSARLSSSFAREATSWTLMKHGLQNEPFHIWYAADIILSDCNKIRCRPSSNYKTVRSIVNREQCSNNVNDAYENEAGCDIVQRQNSRASEMEETVPVQWDVDSENAVALLKHVKHMPGVNVPTYNTEGFSTFFLTLKTEIFYPYCIWQLGQQKFGTWFRVHERATSKIMSEKRSSLQGLSTPWRRCASNHRSQKYTS